MTITCGRHPEQPSSHTQLHRLIEALSGAESLVHDGRALASTPRTTSRAKKAAVALGSSDQGVTTQTEALRAAAFGQHTPGWYAAT